MVHGFPAAPVRTGRAGQFATRPFPRHLHSAHLARRKRGHLPPQSTLRDSSPPLSLLHLHLHAAFPVVPQAHPHLLASGTPHLLFHHPGRHSLHRVTSFRPPLTRTPGPPPALPPPLSGLRSPPQQTYPISDRMHLLLPSAAPTRLKLREAGPLSASVQMDPITPRSPSTVASAPCAEGTKRRDRCLLHGSGTAPLGVFCLGTRVSFPKMSVCIQVIQ